MTKFQGFYNTTISAPKRGLNKRQVKQVQRQIEKNKRIKNYYVPLSGDFTNVATATQRPTYFQELTLVPNTSNSVGRSEDQILLKSYNIKMGAANYTNDASSPTTTVFPITYRVIIVRSKQGGPLTNIVDTGNASIVDFSAQPDPDKFQVYTDEIFTVSGGSSNISLGYLMHFYKSFKNKKVPHMIVGYDDQTAIPNTAISNPIYMKIIMDPDAPSSDYNWSLNGFCHVKFFDKE